jgi:mannose-6-phosphate isomerase-like protein (cupin superfamily)
MPGYVLTENEGERMIQSRGETFIKIDPTRGSHELCLGTQRMPVGVGVPRHVHAYWDEIAYVLDGSGFVTLGDDRLAIQKNSTVFIPKGVWHGFENPDSELFCLWAASPTGQEEFFRAISWLPGEPAKNFSREEVLAIRHQVEADHLKRVQSKA